MSLNGFKWYLLEEIGSLDDSRKYIRFKRVSEDIQCISQYVSQSLQGWCVKDGGSNNNDWSPDRSLKSDVSLQLGGFEQRLLLDGHSRKGLWFKDWVEWWWVRWGYMCSWYTRHTRWSEGDGQGNVRTVIPRRESRLLLLQAIAVAIADYCWYHNHWEGREKTEHVSFPCLFADVFPSNTSIFFHFISLSPFLLTLLNLFPSTRQSILNKLFSYKRMLNTNHLSIKMRTMWDCSIFTIWRNAVECSIHAVKVLWFEIQDCRSETRWNFTSERTTWTLKIC